MRARLQDLSKWYSFNYLNKYLKWNQSFHSFVITQKVISWHVSLNFLKCNLPNLAPLSPKFPQIDAWHAQYLPNTHFKTPKSNFIILMPAMLKTFQHGMVRLCAGLWLAETLPTREAGPISRQDTKSQRHLDDANSQWEATICRGCQTETHGATWMMQRTNERSDMCRWWQSVTTFILKWTQGYRLSLPMVFWLYIIY